MDTKSCVHCRQQIHVDATKCFHCNEWQSQQPSRTAPDSLWGLLSSDLQTISRTIIFVASLLLVVAVISLVFVHFLSDALGKGSSIEVNPQGAITVKLPNKETTVFLLGANGTSKSPWVSTGMIVSKGDKLTISASGQINVSAHHVVEKAKTDELPPNPWSGPEGRKPGYGGVRKIDLDRDAFTLVKAEYGRLIAQIVAKEVALRPSDDKLFFKLGPEPREIVAEIPGILYLAINEVWLTTTPDNNPDSDFAKSNRAYLSTREGNEHYYFERAPDAVKQEMKKLGEGLGLFPLTQSHVDGIRKKKDKSAQENLFLNKLDAAVDLGFKEQEKRWDYIVKHHYDNVWYDDNIGSFAVTIVKAR